MNAMAQHDHHDQLSIALLVDAELTYLDVAPMVSGHYATVST